MSRKSLEREQVRRATGKILRRGLGPAGPGGLQHCPTQGFSVGGVVSGPNVGSRPPVE